MGVDYSVVCIKGSHLGAIEGLLSRLEYRHVNPPLSCLAAREVKAALEASRANDDVESKVAYEANGWTVLFDPEKAVMDDKRLLAFGKENSARIFAWSCNEASDLIEVILVDGGYRRDIQVYKGDMGRDIGEPLAEEAGMDWPKATEADVVALAGRIGAPYDRLSADRRYVLYALEGGPIEAEFQARLLMEPEPSLKPWWKFW